MNIYVFNITNPAEVLDGAPFNVTEVCTGLLFLL